MTHEEEMNALKEELDLEVAEWNKIQMSPKAIEFDLYIMDVQIQSILALLRDLFDVKQEEIEMAFRKNMIKKLKDWRAAFETQVRQDRIRAGVDKPKLVIPGERRIK